VSKDRTPPEIRAVRRRREGNRLLGALGWWALWLALLITGLATGLTVLAWLSWAAFITYLVAIFGLREKALRKIAGRPAPDYNQISRLEKARRKTRTAVQLPGNDDRSL